MGLRDKFKSMMGSNEKKNENKNEPEKSDDIRAPKEILGSTFFDLYQYIFTNGQRSDTIVLEKDYVLGDKMEMMFHNGVEIRHEGIVIDGNGHTIDAQGKARIFDIYADVTIRNVVLMNGNNEGGAAIFNHANLRLENVKFINNSSIQGSAINNFINSNLIVINCLFEGNVAEKNAGAIFNHTTCKVTGSKFINNKSTEDGGAIALAPNSEISIEDCYFEQNSSESMSGGALVNMGKVNIKDSTFIKNSSKEQAGALINRKGAVMTISNSRFEQNAALNNVGGAILNWNKLQIKDTTFKSNRGTSAGSIYNIPNGILFIEDCQFEENLAYEFGGAIRNDGRINLRNSQFTKNKASNLGGAIVNDGSIDLINAEFTGNVASNGGGAIATSKPEDRKSVV